MSGRTGDVDEVLGAAEFEEVRAALAASGVGPDEVAEQLRRRGRPVSPEAVRRVHARVVRETYGLGPLQPLVDDPAVTDVLVNGAGEVRVDRGAGTVDSGVQIASEAEVRRLAQRLASLGGRRLDDAAWWCDVRLPDGTRCHAVLAPVARPGTAISLRVPRERAFSLEELTHSGMLTPAGARVAQKVVERRLGFLVSGGTGAGKTTLLATLLSTVPVTERIVVVEDSSELRPAHPHVVGLEARRANVEGVGAVDLRTLVRQALRMRPDRLVLGEVRGVEVLDLLAAMNTGHEGGCGTLHANSALQVPARVEALAAPAGHGAAAVQSQLLAAVQVVLHVSRGSDGRRRLSEVAVLEADDRGRVRALPALVAQGDGTLREGPGAPGLAELLG